MKEIKFRAWDKVLNKMLKVTQLDFADWWVQCSCGKFRVGERNSFKNQDTDRFILEEFTGLRDKNGIEIYEGDLIEVKTDKHHFISEITWDDKASCFEFQDTQNSYCCLDAINIFENGKSLYGGFVEVIGNIHERSE